MEIVCEYCSNACNRTPKSFRWAPTKAEAIFGGGKSVFLVTLHEEVARVLYTLPGHRERVNCVSYLRFRGNVAAEDCSNSNEFISGSVDNSIILWQRKADRFKQKQMLEGHVGAVVALAASYLPPSDKPVSDMEDWTGQPSIIVSASSDSTIKIWVREVQDGEFTMKQSLSLNRGFVMGLDVYFMKNSKRPILAAGGDDCRVSLFEWQDGQLLKLMTLTGHEDWIRDLQFASLNNGDILLASASQDAYIRLWNITTLQIDTEKEDSKEIQLKKNFFTLSCQGDKVKERKYTVSLEAVLIGHEDWIYSVDWHPPLIRDGKVYQPQQLISASMDKTVIVWSLDKESEMWMEQARVGEVGGNTLGLYGGVYSNDGERFVAHGYQGAFHIWKLDQENQKWCPQVALSGHFGSVLDLSWDPLGLFFLSVSSDQTTRLHAPWKQEDKMVTWHEISRPQVHGYNMQCVAMTTSSQFISGGDEKVLRVFEAPTLFFESMRSISGIDLSQTCTAVSLGASIPALGLSNKAVLSEAVIPEPTEDQGPVKNLFSDHQIPYFMPVKLTAPPVEETLLQNTLWPEVQKLYGHGFEVYSVAASSDGKLIASACKASKPEHASIRVWDTATWKQIDLLSHHSLTITQIAFSHDSKRILAVSRDRCWSLWNQKNSIDQADKISFSLEAALDKSAKSHTRIIWSCSWSPDDCCFITASRDRKACVWSMGIGMECDCGWRLVGEALICEVAITAVDFAPITLSSRRYAVALGLEDGQIKLYHFDLNSGKWSLLANVDPIISPCDAIKCLKWQPVPFSEIGELNGRGILLAACCSDGSVRLYNIKF